MERTISSLKSNVQVLENRVKTSKSTIDDKIYQMAQLNTEKNKYQINLNPIYYIEDLSLNIHGEINQINEEESTYIFEIFPMTSPEIKSEFKIQCEDDLCPFQFKISETILIDTYIVNIYSPLGDSQKTFKVEFAKDKIKIEIDMICSREIDPIVIK